MLQKVNFVKELEHIMLLVKDSQTKSVGDTIEFKKELLKRTSQQQIARLREALERNNPEKTLQDYFEGRLGANYILGMIADADKKATEISQEIEVYETLYLGIFGEEYVFSAEHAKNEYINELYKNEPGYTGISEAMASYR